MSTADLQETTSRPRTALILGLIVAVSMAVALPLAAVLRDHGPGRMWIGVLVGAGVALVGALLAAWRVMRRPASATVADRALLHAGDERDDLVLTRSLAVVGLCALVAVPLVAVAIALGTAALAAVGVTTYALLGVMVVSFVVNNRRS